MSEPPSKRPGRRERSRQRLLDAAFALLAERGFEGTTAAEVCQAADLAVGTFYNHFADKAAMKDEVVALAVAGHAHLLDWATAAAIDPATRTALAVKASVLRAARLPQWAGFVGRFGLTEPGLRAVLGCGAEVAATEMAPDHAIASAAGIVAAFSAMAAESDGVAEAGAAAMAVLRAIGIDAVTSAEAASTALPE